MGAVTETIRDKLSQAFSPDRLEIKDDSDRHHGHSGAREGGESHFNVVIEAAAFKGLNRVQRQRAIYAALKDELAGPIHALSLVVLAPGEEP
ncbi:MAG: BolA family transcriptional regulator [Caulobacteraceae bacterium]|nr:BolA family transcriptional regulator [Caulobacteraceae bacterium]